MPILQVTDISNVGTCANQLIKVTCQAAFIDIGLRYPPEYHRHCTSCGRIFCYQKGHTETNCYLHGGKDNPGQCQTL